MTMVQPVHVVGRLSASQVTEVLALADAAFTADGVYPLSEDVVLQVRHSSSGRHLLTYDGDALAGYAFLIAGQEGDEGEAGGGHHDSGELVVDPRFRLRGHGRALLTAAGDGPLRFWAHGDEPAARAFAGKAGFERVRVLFQMRRKLTEPLPDAPLPAGVTLRGFRPGHDEKAWLGVNSRAFIDHPEQGRWSLDDLRMREEEPWFDPAGFLLAVDIEDTLLGFHWTKVHPATGGEAAIGEIYVLAVDPGGHRRGLGRALSVAGLRHLADAGLTGAMLYVDESNEAAVALYRRLGFDVYAADVSYQR
jgi:mycothiol synthase